MREFFKELNKVLMNTKELNKEKINKIKIKLCTKYHLKKIPSDYEVLLNTKQPNLKQILKAKPTRTISGVSPIAIMTKPLPCPHGKCTMCPGGLESFFGDVPQSYTGKEPATRRAIRNDYDPYLQVFNRLEQYTILGHPIDKVELIIMGGTFPSFDVNYQKEFVAYAYKAMNDFGKIFFKNRKIDIEKFKKFFDLPSDINNKERETRIKNKILKFKKIADLKKVQIENETAEIRCVAQCIETRPDYCKQEHIKLMLELGTTRVELGVQSVYDNILNEINRGHSVEDSIIATRLLRESLLKVGYHIMIGLPKSTPEMDVQMFKILFGDNRFKPDFLKIYPCQIVKGTKLYDSWKQGKFKPLTIPEAIDILIKAKQYVPEYCRIMRIQRDIPSNTIEAGVLMTNLRQYLHEIMNKKGIKCRCIRCREIGTRLKQGIKVENQPIIKTLEYKTSGGKEFFISAVDKETDTIFGFCRLQISKQNNGIRELHVYGSAIPIGDSNNKATQHKGLGKKLLHTAEEIVLKKSKNKTLKIISGIGVREYYKKLGYERQGFYMVKNLAKPL